MRDKINIFMNRNEKKNTSHQNIRIQLWISRPADGVALLCHLAVPSTEAKMKEKNTALFRPRAIEIAAAGVATLYALYGINNGFTEI